MNRDLDAEEEPTVGKAGRTASKERATQEKVLGEAATRSAVHRHPASHPKGGGRWH